MSVCSTGLDYRSLSHAGAHRDKDHVLPLLLQSACLAPSHAATFSLLGQYYDEVEQDERKALKCYQRAVALEPGTQEHAAQRLCQMYAQTGQQVLIDALLRYFSFVSR